MGSGVGGRRRVGGRPAAAGFGGARGPLARAGRPSGRVGGLALRLSVVSHSPFQFRRRAGAEPLSPDTYPISPSGHRPPSAENW